MNKRELHDLIREKRVKTNKFTRPSKEFLDSLKDHTSHLVLPENITISQLVWHFEYDVPVPTCEECQKKPCKWNNASKQYRNFCSTKCSNRNESTKAKIRQTQDANGGHPSIRVSAKEKREATNIERYGNKSHLMNEDVKNKTRETMKNRYGHEYYSQTPQAKKEKREWLKNNPEHLSVMLDKAKEYKQSDKYKTDYREAVIKRLGLNGVKNEKDFKEYLRIEHVKNQKTTLEISKNIDLHVSNVCRWLDKLNVDRQYFLTSTEEDEVYDFLNCVTDTKIILQDRKILNGLELDLYMPDKELAIEYCGLYWHSEIYKDKYYHQTKYLKCKEKGIRLITLFQDEWRHKKDIVKRMLLNRLGESQENKFYARNTKVITITDYTLVKNFLENNHIQGPTTGKFYLGLETSENELVALAVFRELPDNTYELKRYATSGIVAGGFSKILKAFERSLPYAGVCTTFADLRWSKGDLYTNAGFEEVAILKPDYSFIKSDARIHKFNMRTITADKFNDASEKYSINEKACMMGYHKIYDCGKIKYAKNLG